ncbi:flavin reductase like domain protein [Anaplasma phagocytophilum str. CRT53-1]|uniref:Flavin reductase like domain protein n=6 Tax=Anaplasma phagocytophilum TaxID=948 RepID=A0A0F3Q4Y5_ANAPH|nr:flavin reductase family protein [Anaplasma phagocytophilum str. CRT38]KJV87553.1 flavin reductase like domain protein [Anaplasma phagocytophilum str. CRT53-1]
MFGSYSLGACCAFCMQQLGSISAKRFKSCMGRFATGVTVVTTVDSSGAQHGVTVSSFNSVSLDPPLVLFSIQKSSSRFAAFSQCTEFVVNILSDAQKDVSQDFACNLVENWDSHDYIKLSGIPVICGSIAYFHCALYRLYDGGDHKIVVGRVLDCATLEDDDPLLHYRGSYWSINHEL